MRRRVLPAALAGVLLALVAGCSRAGDAPVLGSSPAGEQPSIPSAATPADTPPAAPLARYYDQRPAWAPCGDDFECARVSVPLDYARPGGQDLELAVVRLPAAGGQRIGSLLLNPGGPGGSGVEYARAARQVISEPVRARFDVVGFDPRGVGDSQPVDCLGDEQLDAFLAADGSPDSPEEEQALFADARELAQGCERRSEDVLPYVSTEDAARDLDVLRGVLGDERLHYLGKSYGTYLGGMYAQLFPGRVGAVVLDGAVDPRVPDDEFALQQAKGFETALGAFVDDCLRVQCPLRGPREAALLQVRDLLEGIDREPLEARDGRKVTQSLALLGIAGALYDQTYGWPLLRQALEQALAADGTTLLLIADFYTERQPDGSYASNQNEATYAVNCLDSPEREADLEHLRQQDTRFAVEAPTFGRYLAWSALPCSVWPVPARPGPEPFRAAGARPILVLGTVRDPATPYAWAVGLADQLESGVLLTWDGDGHTAYQRGSRCIDDTVDAYLLRGEVPEDGRRCT